MLVLAIAGLIFLMVFIALPALQRSQRDTQRRNDMSRLSTAINQYQTNNNGKLPADGSLEPLDDDLSIPGCSNTKDGAKCLVTNYMNSVNAVENEFVDPDGWRYGVRIYTYGGAGAPQNPGGAFDHIVYIVKSAACDGESVTKSNNSRDYAIVYKLEGSGTYCHDNGSGAASSNPSGDSGE